MPNEKAAWPVPGADCFLFTTYGKVETVNDDTSLVLAFTRGRYTTRRYLSPVEVKSLLGSGDLRPRYRLL